MCSTQNEFCLLFHIVGGKKNLITFSWYHLGSFNICNYEQFWLYFQKLFYFLRDEVVFINHNEIFCLLGASPKELKIGTLAPKSDAKNYFPDF